MRPGISQLLSAGNGKFACDRSSWDVYCTLWLRYQGRSLEPHLQRGYYVFVYYVFVFFEALQRTETIPHTRSRITCLALFLGSRIIRDTDRYDPITTEQNKASSCECVWEIGGIAPLILNRGEWSASRSDHFIPLSKKPKYPLNRRPHW